MQKEGLPLRPRAMVNKPYRRDKLVFRRREPPRYYGLPHRRYSELGLCCSWEYQFTSGVAPRALAHTLLNNPSVLRPPFDFHLLKTAGVFCECTSVCIVRAGLSAVPLQSLAAPGEAPPYRLQPYSLPGYRMHSEVANPANITHLWLLRHKQHSVTSIERRVGVWSPLALCLPAFHSTPARTPLSNSDCGVSARHRVGGFTSTSSNFQAILLSWQVLGRGTAIRAG